MDYRVLRVHTAHDDLEFKTLEPKALLTALSHTSNASVTSRPPGPLLLLPQSIL